ICPFAGAVGAAGAGTAEAEPPGTEALEAALARVCAAAERPLLVLLDAAEEAPGPLGPSWWTATADWLAGAGVRLLVACRPESWEQWQQHGPVLGAAATPQLHRLRPLGGPALEAAARQYGVLVDGQPAGPLLLRLAGELRAAGVPPFTVGPTGVGAAELYQAWLDLRCLRIAERLARTGVRPASHRKGNALPAAAPPAPGRVRRLAALVAGRVHEAARRMLGPGQGGLTRAAFEELFPPAGGWARAVLADGLFVPAGEGYRPAHEEIADWLQGQHLELDGALRLLLAEGPRATAAQPRWVVPRHRAGAVAAALGTLARTRGTAGLAPWLDRLWQALAQPAPGAVPQVDVAGTAAVGPLEASAVEPEPRWWAARLLAAGLRAAPEPAAHGELLERLAEWLAAGTAATIGPGGAAPDPVAARFGPAFWADLELPADRYWELLRLLVRADGAEPAFLAAAAAGLTGAGTAGFGPLCRWFADGRPLPARAGATVADLAHDLLFAHRALGVDELTEALVATGHPRADALLTVLAVEEPSALCRAVDRWSHDARPDRHVAAAVHALRTAPYVTGAARELLRHTALTLLARVAEPGLHGAALALLVRDPATRARYLPAALAGYAADDPFVGAEVLGLALADHPAAVLGAFEERLARPGGGAAAALRVLADAPP
ncbi:serine protease, partial [Kitasatospora sp. LaBMicrA B282]